jgi:CheY-like chemotaxis protein
MKKILRLLRGKPAETEKNSKELNKKTGNDIKDIKTDNDIKDIKTNITQDREISDKKTGININIDVDPKNKIISLAPSKSAKFIIGTSSASEIIKDRDKDDDTDDGSKHLKDLKKSIIDSEESQESKKSEESKESNIMNLSKLTNDNVPSLPTNKNGKHLICDDSEPNRMVLSKYLTRKNYVIEEAINGLDAIDKITKSDGEYHVVWMDIMMPRMNGMDCTNTLRQKYGYKGVIIGLTGYIDQDSVNQCYKLGMNHVIGKPIDKGTLYHYAEKYTHPTI